MAQYIIILIGVTIGGFAQLFLKQGTLGADLSNISGLINLFLNKFTLFGVFLYGTSFILWMIGISKLPITTAYPMMSLSFIIVILGGRFMGETIGVLKILGVVMILGGIFLITR